MHESLRALARQHQLGERSPRAQGHQSASSPPDAPTAAREAAATRQPPASRHRPIPDAVLARSKMDPDRSATAGVGCAAVFGLSHVVAVPRGVARGGLRRVVATRRERNVSRRRQSEHRVGCRVGRWSSELAISAAEPRNARHQAQALERRYASAAVELLRQHQ